MKSSQQRKKRKEILERLHAFKNEADVKRNGEIWDFVHYALDSISLFKFCIEVILIFQTHRLQNKEQNPKTGQTATTKMLCEATFLGIKQFQSEDILLEMINDFTRR